MLRTLNHRGPDESGIYIDNAVGLGHARLSIIDLAGGKQPIHNEDKSIWISYNGEVFNYPELMENLKKKGHIFYTKTDTEVIVHLYEEKGEDFLKELNGQFAFALWDGKKKKLILARDRMGIRPLFFTTTNGTLHFSSEIKAIFEDKSIKAEIDPMGIDQLFTFWCIMPPRTSFKNIQQIPPAHYLTAQNGSFQIKRYWSMQFPEAVDLHSGNLSEDYYAEKLLSLLLDSIKIRLRADVPVASYLSGGLDSSLISALIKKNFNNRLETFSVSFQDKKFDESFHQNTMAKALGTVHRSINCGYSDIGNAIPEVVRHAESPLIRTAPAPMFLLSKLVRDSGIKVVLTGEGADEILGGYDLFKEMKIRRFWAKFAGSKLRPKLLSKLYPYSDGLSQVNQSFLEAFYKRHLSETASPYYSHMPRWDTTSYIKSFYSEEMKHNLAGYDCREEFTSNLPADFSKWHTLSQAQFIESVTLLSGNLLSSQGDRMAMAHSVEGRYPFLDYRVIEFCAAIPPQLKLKVLNEKYLLKKIAAPFLPADIPKRIKQPYGSPDTSSFFSGNKYDYLEELLSEQNLKNNPYFDASSVNRLMKKSQEKSTSFSMRHNIAVTGVITTLLLDNIFVK